MRSKLAARNIREFAERQLPQEWNLEPVPGLKTGQVCGRSIRWDAMCRAGDIRCPRRC